MSHRSAAKRHTVSASRLNVASYSRNFSTVFRIAHGAYTDMEITFRDVDGRDPLPLHLFQARIRLHEFAEEQAQTVVEVVDGRAREAETF